MNFNPDLLAVAIESEHFITRARLGLDFAGGAADHRGNIERTGRAGISQPRLEAARVLEQRTHDLVRHVGKALPSHLGLAAESIGQTGEDFPL